MEAGFWHGLWTLVLVITFIAIVRWAFSAKQAKRFEEAARIPLDDDPDTTPAQQTPPQNTLRDACHNG